MSTQPKRVLFVATVVKTHIMTFHIPFLKMFKEMGWETTVVAKNDYDDPSDCQIPYCDHYIDMPFVRQPLHYDNLLCYKKLKKIIDEGEYTIIHCHTPVGGVLGRLAARQARKKGTRVIYTAHGFHFYKGAPLKNWLFYYPVEKLCSHFTDVLITINKEDFEFAKKKMRAKQLEYVPGVGIDVEKFSQENSSDTDLRKTYKISENEKIILSVGELNENKNQKVIVRSLTFDDMEKVHYLIAGDGEKRLWLEEYATELGVNSRVHFLGYRRDIESLLKNVDAFVFPSYREGLPVSLMEAMASGIPMIASKVRGNVDLVEDGINGFLCDPDDAEDFAKKINLVLSDNQLAERFSEENKERIKNLDQKIVTEEIRKIYMYVEGLGIERG